MREWKLFHPERFQGAKKKYHCFEGWYFKIAVQQPTKQVLSLIHIGENTFRWEKVHIRLTDVGRRKRPIYDSIDGMPHLRVETIQGNLVIEGDSSHAGLGSARHPS